jgi:hypothetical protein
MDPAHGQLVGDALRTPSRLSEGLREDPPFDLRVQQGRPSRPPLAALGVQPI